MVVVEVVLEVVVELEGLEARVPPTSRLMVILVQPAPAPCRWWT